jgi:hypothetical protein
LLKKETTRTRELDRLLYFLPITESPSLLQSCTRQRAFS